jgi:hypothetical protein
MSHTSNVPVDPWIHEARQERVLTYRTPGPHFSMAGAMHHWHRGQPPGPYLWGLRRLLCTSPEWAARGFGVARRGVLLGRPRIGRSR